VAHRLDHPGPVAVGDDPRERHSHAEGVLAFFHIPRADAGCGDADADLPQARLGARHFAHDEDARRRSLPFVPGSFHYPSKHPSGNRPNKSSPAGPNVGRPLVRAQFHRPASLQRTAATATFDP